MSSEVGLEVRDVTVRYGSLTAVDQASIDVDPGAIVALLGPSGCGKSTLLRAIAGLEPLAGGSISWMGSDLTGVPVHRRHGGLMFQDHALFPHRNVADNVAFGLRMEGRPRAARRRRVEELLDLFGLVELGSRTIGTLSGGQAQRVALARALAPEPSLLLLDEPLGSLDRALRDRLVHEIREAIRELGITAIHVTHDHDEAVTVADALALMRDGRIHRVGPVAALLDDPGDARTAEALGIDTVWRPPQRPDGTLVTPFGAVPPAVGGGAGPYLLLRPRSVQLADNGQAATVDRCRYRGGVWLVTCELVDHRLAIVAAHHERLGEGTAVRVRADLTQATRLEP